MTNDEKQKAFFKDLANGSLDLVFDLAKKHSLQLPMTEAFIVAAQVAEQTAFFAVSVEKIFKEACGDEA